MTMQKVTGNSGMPLLECVNPKRDKWKMRWAVEEKEDGTAEYMEEDYGHKPTPGDIEKTLSDSVYDASEDELETIGSVLGYDKSGFETALDEERDARIASSPQAQLMEVMREQLLEKTDITDEQALKVPNMFFTFSYLCKRGKEVKAGTIIRYNNKTWRIVQDHTPQEIYPPSMDTAALYTMIDKSHAGTLDDPIPYEQGMAFEKGKYYSQDGKTYLCILTTATGYPYDLKDLPTIVQAV